MSESTGTPIKSVNDQSQTLKDDLGSQTAVKNADAPQRDVILQDSRQQEPKPDTAPVTPMSPEERAKRKAMIVQAYDRGIIHDRLSVKLPPHLHGEWARNDPLEIDRLRTLGFEIDTEYANRRSLHNDGGDAAIIGDVIFMTCPREVKEIIDEIRLEKFMAVNGKPGDRKAKTKEEREFEANSARDTQGIVPTIVESDTSTRFSRADVESALEKVDRQTQPQTPPTR